MPLNNFNYTLSWIDLTPRAARPPGQTEDAGVVVRYNYNYQTGRDRNAVTIADATVDITMVSTDSWVLSGQKTNYLLQHEQRHYDITALGAREFYNALLALSARTEHALQTNVTQLNQRYQQKINRANSRYDAQTNHSRNTQAQQTWNQRIATEMQNANGSIDNLP